MDSFSINEFQSFVSATFSVKTRDQFDSKHTLVSTNCARSIIIIVREQRIRSNLRFNRMHRPSARGSTIFLHPRKHRDRCITSCAIYIYICVCRFLESLTKRSWKAMELNRKWRKIEYINRSV